MAEPLNRTPWWHWRSMRLHTVVVVCVVAAAPVIWVWSSGVADQTLRVQRSLDVQGVAEQLLGDPADPTALARRSNVRIRAWDRDGTEVIDADGRHPTVLDRWDHVFAEGDPPTLEAFEAMGPPVLERALVRDAGPVPLTECRSNAELSLWVCESVVRTDQRLWLVQRSSRRPLRALYELRYRVLQLALGVGVIALALGVWIALRWVRPIAALRDAALDRVDRPLAAAPLGLSRSDEIGELARAFDALLAAVRTQADAHETFVADLAHEMKNPVAAIRSCAESLETGEAIGSERAQRLARILGDSSERLQRVLSELLDLARAEAGLPGDQRERIDLGALVRGVAGDRVVQAVPIEISAVPERIEALVRNLIDNAVSFAGPEGSIEIRVFEDAGEAVLIVADDGPGIAPELLPRVFERFFTTRGTGRGTGVGLALVKAVAEAHGGTVAVASSGGAVFTVRLPRA